MKNMHDRWEISVKKVKTVKKRQMEMLEMKTQYRDEKFPLRVGQLTGHREQRINKLKVNINYLKWNMMQKKCEKEK